MTQFTETLTFYPRRLPGLFPRRLPALFPRRLPAVLAALAFVVLALPADPADARPAPESFADLAEALLPSVVNISTTQLRDSPEDLPALPEVPEGSPFEDFFNEFRDRLQRRATSLGSGFVIDAAGYIVTNNHVIANADEITVTFQDDRTLPAEIVGTDPKTDLALLKVEPDFDLVAARWGNSDTLRVGDWVMAIGNPFGFGGTVTAGIVSARERNINAGPYDDFIQTDAAINRGNSGGPLFDTDGRVVGINTAIISPTGGSIGIGFSVPAALAEPVIRQLREHGRAIRGWLGVRVQQVEEDFIGELGLDEVRGALVASVIEGGPAEAAGIEAGDVILEFDGVDIEEMRRLVRVVGDTVVDRAVDVVVLRDGEMLNLEVVVAELIEEEVQEVAVGNSGGRPDRTVTEAIGSLGLELSAIDDELRRRYELGGDVEGVVITAVIPGSPANAEGLQPGDVILEAGQREVTDPSDVREKVIEAENDPGRRSILLLVQRGNQPPRFLALRINRS